MRKKLLLIAALMMMALSMPAAPVDATTASSKAASFVQNHEGNGRLMSSSPDVTLVHTATSTVDASQATYYIFNTSSSFVIVSGDDRAQEVLMYGDAPLDMNSIPTNMQVWLDGYQEQLDWLIANPDAEVQTVAQRAPRRATKAVEPLLTAIWDQSAPFYNLCPTVGGNTCLTGCPATSLSMIFYFWKWPTSATGEIPAYSDYNGTSYDALSSTTFQWSLMRDDYTGSYTTAQGNAVATLMRYVGQAEHMAYGVNSSGILATEASLIVDACNLLGYDSNTVRLVQKTTALSDGETLYTDNEWQEMMINELEEGRPIEYLAISSMKGGHAFNVDGYDGDGMFHINWGWSGSGNGYCALNAFADNAAAVFNQFQQMVIGIQPPEEYFGPYIRVKPTDVEVAGRVGDTTTVTFELSSVNLTDAVTLTLEDENGVFAVNPSTISIAASEDTAMVTVSFIPQDFGTFTATVVCRSPGAVDRTVTVTGNATLRKYVPVMQPADESAITSTSFRADWTDQTPSRHVAGYTLEVSQEELIPTVQLLDERDWSGLAKESGNKASNASAYLPDGWEFSGSRLYLDGGCISLYRGSTIITREYDFTGYDKATVVITGKAYSTSSVGSSTLTLSTASNEDDTQILTLQADYATDTIVLDVATTDQIIMLAGYYPDLRCIEVYAGDLREVPSLMAPKVSGSDTYRLIEGITPDRAYTVTNLLSGGTFYYRVKTQFTDGTWCDWSNIQTVTLVAGSHTVGDVNSDGDINISDVTVLIDRVLAGKAMDGCCEECADVNGDGTIDITDVTALIDMVLAGK